MSFWEHVPGSPPGEEDRAAAGASLSAIHSAFSGYPGELPSFRAQIEHAGELLARGNALTALTDEDRSFLRGRRNRLVAQLEVDDAHQQPLHGEAHLANVMRTDDGLRWFDFESVCRGPLEWDLATLPDEALDVFGDFDRALLELLRRLRSLCVAVWCWVQPDRAPEVAEAAHYHLQLQREASP